MMRRKKYNVFISVATEDLDAAKRLAAALKAKGISYYFYPEQDAHGWGKVLFDWIYQCLLGSRIVLFMVSKHSDRKYWTKMEKQIAGVLGSKALELYLDETLIDAKKNVLALKWDNNPEHIASLIFKKMKTMRSARLGRSAFLLGVIAAIIYAFFWLQPLSSIHLPTQRRAYMEHGSKVLVPGGSFTMGTGNRQPNEAPAHIVNIRPFYINSTEVTVGEYRKFCSSQGRLMPDQPSHRFSEYCPVVNVSWDDAVAYCNWVGGRLPSEAEWEYAAGAGAGTTYSGGNNASKVANYNALKPSRIALKEANGFGLYDMSGNAFEWCQDWYASYDPSANAVTDPNGPGSRKEKVVRGGAYDSGVSGINPLRVTYRGKEPPATRKIDLGFRVAWDQNK